MQTATYKGKTYNLAYIGQTKYGRRAKLAFLNGSKEFWVDASLVTVGGAAKSRAKSSTSLSGGWWECRCCGEENKPGARNCWECGSGR